MKKSPLRLLREGPARSAVDVSPATILSRAHWGVRMKSLAFGVCVAVRHLFWDLQRQKRPFDARILTREGLPLKLQGNFPCTNLEVVSFPRA